MRGKENENLLIRFLYCGERRGGEKIKIVNNLDVNIFFVFVIFKYCFGSLIL